MNVYSVHGTEFQLPPHSLAEGGEGAVFDITGYRNRVAKIYKDLDDAKNRHKKIEAMIDMAEGSAFRQSGLKDYVTWPLAALYNDKNEFIGYGMEKISGAVKLGELYKYPCNSANFNMKDRVTVLIKLCEALEKLHGLGQVLGDFNPDNILVSPKDASVTFLDADSFHIRHKGELYKTVVCGLGYVAPELITKVKGSTFKDCKGETFTKFTDLYGLATHVFRMLFNGVHPYHCSVASSTKSHPAPQTTLEGRVERGETPFFTSVKGVEPPAFAPDVKETIPRYIYDLFHKAFVDGHRDPKLRPDATTWKQALQRFRVDLIPCKKDSLHYHLSSVKKCPYCEADRRRKEAVAKATAAYVALDPLKPAASPGGNTAATQPTTHFVAPPKPTKPKISCGFFTWLLSLAITAASIWAVFSLLPMEHYLFWVWGEEWMSNVSYFILPFAILLGSIVFNGFWATRSTGWNLVLSPLCGWAFGGASILAELVLVLVVTLIGFVLVIAFIVALCND